MFSSPLLIERSSTLNLFNRTGSLVNTLGLDLFKLNRDRLLEHAKSVTDFSCTDTLVKEGLGRLIESIQQEANLNTFGKFVHRNMLQRSLVARFHIERQLVQNAAIAEEDISEPIFIIGMPRTGTTILHALLHVDDAHRSPLCWECLLPYPVPTPEDFADNDRLNAIQKEFDAIFKLVPDFKKMHYMEADTPQECIGITALNFTSFQYVAQCYIPSYYEWFTTELDQTANLHWHRNFLQYLQSGGVKASRWLLKSPVHLTRLANLFEVYPDACVVMLHRDPINVVPSCASLVSSMRSLYSDHEDPKRTGREQLQIWGRYFDSFLSDRKKLDKEDRILDFDFSRFATDQMGVVESIYRHFGWTLSDETRINMKSFLVREPKDKHGKHQYSLDQFGLSESDIEAHYATYLDFLSQSTTELAN